MRKLKINEPEARFDCIVVGGGLAGTTAACAMAKAGLETLLLAPLAPKDHRTSALMCPSVDILHNLGLVEDPAHLGVSLEKIRIIDATNRLIRAPEVLFDSSEIGQDAFGWNFSNAKMLDNFQEVLGGYKNLEQRDTSATHLEKSETGWVLNLSDGSRVSTKLLVGADGKKSFVRDALGISLHETRHRQSALVCDLALGTPLNGQSVEFHYENGPFTLVPAGKNKANLVWVDRGEVLEKVKSGNSESIVASIQNRSHNLFGRLLLETGVFVFPLTSFKARELGRDGVVLAGEAAHAFPPIGAQGLNLSLRDVAELAKIVGAADRANPRWAEKVSALYDKARGADIARTNAMVDTLFRSLLSDLLPAQVLRSGGVWALKLLPPLRKKAFAMGMDPS